MAGDSSTTTLTKEDFVRRLSVIKSFGDLQALRKDALATENLWRELFARQRDSWEVPEVDDPYLFLVNVFEHTDLFRRLPYFAEEDSEPRCHALTDKNRLPEGALSIVPSRSQFELSWDCFTEGLLRFVDWNNVFCAGGSVAGCLAPLPPDIAEGKISATRVKRRKYFHDTFLPGSDIDLFLYGLNEEEAELKLVEIFDAVQAANPYEIKAFRSRHAITLVSRYPFRHVQIVLRLYNSPAEVLMGFDVDSCSVGYDGKNVLVCPRTTVAMVTQSNLVDMTRRSPSYEMRLAKYAQRGFEVVVPGLIRDRVDPFLYEKRFDQTKGLSRLLLLERLRTPLERLRFRIEAQLKHKSSQNMNIEWMIQSKIRQIAYDNRNVDRAEGLEGIIPSVSGPEASDYSTVFLPWGPNWTLERIERQFKKKDKILNSVEFLSDGRVVKSRRPYKIHVCAVGTMEEVICDPFPNDPPIPVDTLPSETLESMVQGKLQWLVDNPGRQQIGSFHPITTNDWTDGAYISRATEALIMAAISNDAKAISKLLEECDDSEEKNAASLLLSRDFLGRSSLHVAALSQSADAAKALLYHPAANADFLQCRLADGRTALHLAAIRGDVSVATSILEKRKELAVKLLLENNQGEDEDDEDPEFDEESAPTEILDIDGADWEVKMSPLQYAIVLGHVEMARLLLSFGSSARKLAVHKDRKESLSSLSCYAVFASECGEKGEHILRPMAEILIGAGASTAQVDTHGTTVWHRFATSTNPYSHKALKILLELDAAAAAAAHGTKKARALDVIDPQSRTALFVATTCGNAPAAALLLEAGATAVFSEKEWELRVRQVQESKSSMGAGRSSYYYGNSASNNLSDEVKRCPIALAAQNADGPCLEAYLKFDKALANATIRVPDTSAKRHQDGFGRQSTATSKFVRPVDLLESARKNVVGDDENNRNDKRWKSQNIKRYQDQVVFAEKKLKMAQSKQEEHRIGSYPHFVWSLVVCQEKEALAEAEYQVRRMETSKSEDDLRNEKEALKQIEEASRIVRDAGGKPQPDDNKKEEVVPQQPSFSNPPMNPNDPSPVDPFLSYAEIGIQPFGTLVMTTYGQYRGNVILSESSQKSAFDLMVAISTRNIEHIQKASFSSKIGIVDSVGTTPIFLAAKTGDVNVLREVFKAAKRQFQSFVDWQKATEKKKEENESPGEDKTEFLLTDQLRRLNNLEIAAGEVPRNTVQTPDAMRECLEAAEESAGNQAAESEALDFSSSKLSPERLLLHRSIVLPEEEEEPRLLQLKQYLQDKQPQSFSKAWLRHPVQLRPIEIAIIRGDEKMVEALIELATDVAHEKCNKDEILTTGEDGADPVMDSGEGEECAEEFEEDFDEEYDEECTEESEEDYDEEYSDYSEAYSDDYDHQDDTTESKQDLSLTASQLHYLLAGEASANPDLNGMTLPQLAIALDNVSIFFLIAKYAKHHMLPRGAVVAWKQEVDDAELSGENKDTKAREKRENETNIISSSVQYWQRNLSPPEWITYSNNRRNRPGTLLHQTPLQFSLLIGSTKISEVLLSGEADAVLLNWITNSSGKQEEFATNKNKREGDTEVGKGVAIAATWVAQQVSKKGINLQQLARRLIRPTACDGIGRTALFYAPAEMVTRVVDSAVKSSLLDDSKKSEGEIKASFLEALTKKGSVTALKAAASAGEVERVKALVNIGASRCMPAGPKSWNPVHLAIPKKEMIVYWQRKRKDPSSAEDNNDDEPSPWEVSKQIVDTLLDGADLSDVLEALLSPLSEHSPLMLAVDRGADGEMIKYFLKKLPSKVKEALNGRDGELNNALHLAVKHILAKGSRNDDVNMDNISALLELADNQGILGTNTENANGVTPFDLALYSVASVWIRAASSAVNSNHNLNRTRRNQGVLPPKVISRVDAHGAVNERKVLMLLQNEESHGTGGSGQRLPVSFEEVKAAKQKSAEGASMSAAAAYRKYKNRGQAEDTSEQIEPEGPPSAFPIMQDNSYRALVPPPKWHHWPR